MATVISQSAGRMTYAVRVSSDQYLALGNDGNWTTTSNMLDMYRWHVKAKAEAVSAAWKDSRVIGVTETLYIDRADLY